MDNDLSDCNMSRLLKIHVAIEGPELSNIPFHDWMFIEGEELMD